MPGRRVLLVDDHSDFRTSALAWLTHEGFAVVGSFASGEEVLAADTEVVADLVLLDLNLPGMSGLEVADALAARGGPTVVIISSDAEARHDPAVIAAPVAGFLAKNELTCAAIDALLS